LVKGALADRSPEDKRPVVIAAADEGRFGRLIVQPPHSPELNAVEHVWEEIREQPHDRTLGN
jgi:transposase